MIRIAYIAGRFRHYRPDGSFDEKLMLQEERNEMEWASLVAKAGLMWVAPLANSVPITGIISQSQFIERDKAIIRRLRPEYDMILMRPGWDDDPESKGAREEYECATEHGLVVVHGMQGKEAVSRYLAELNEIKA